MRWGPSDLTPSKPSPSLGALFLLGGVGCGRFRVRWGLNSPTSLNPFPSFCFLCFCCEFFVGEVGPKGHTSPNPLLYYFPFFTWFSYSSLFPPCQWKITLLFPACLQFASSKLQEPFFKYNCLFCCLDSPLPSSILGFAKSSFNVFF